MGSEYAERQRSTVLESALVVIDLANDLVFPGGVIADAGGPEYQKRADCCARRYASDPARQLRTTDEVIAEWAAASTGHPERRAAHQPARAGQA
jgi:nicotinamidase-related amidase